VSPKKKAPKKKHKLTEGVIPWATQKGIDEFAAGRVMKKVGGQVKRALSHVYPDEKK
jgi:hypothetical protein